MKKYILFALILFTLSCTSETTQYISTTPVTKISANYATSGGYGIHVSSLTETGVVWSTHPQPTIRDTKIMSLNQELFEKAKTPITFTANLSDLQPNTKYYIRAYITTKYSTVYGDELEFVTTK